MWNAINHIPSKEQWEFVLDTLAKVLPMAKRDYQLDMGEVKVNTEGHKCNTIHCFGGWYAVARLDKRKKLNYIDGAEQLAMDLGFKSKECLKKWANFNDEIWGNIYGDAIFILSYAFVSKKRPKGANNLRDIFDHLKEVAERCNAKTKNNLNDKPCNKSENRQTC